jgi:hypothetical protein
VDSLDICKSFEFGFYVFWRNFIQFNDTRDDGDTFDCSWPSILVIKEKYEKFEIKKFLEGLQFFLLRNSFK